ncbi:MFS transporter [Gluconobacter wancherniae]|uniref:MFS transporter n=1 Tax=Gluconobacter wancherniae NBRC 103581 TaxID=656744 RepID=A0A511AVY6_9PROT|nr:MFS transporter [Gluconobacter wancherniae]MBF0852575.1 MFS transporter [Gluconobacter wancherniae]GBD56713.1 MFS transporter [Gluconobacter wancherniae NBRC 103581]GEK92380.1 MFS transporter [Gluconobacter wancherniae NBRC 103581]
MSEQIQHLSTPAPELVPPLVGYRPQTFTAQYLGLLIFMIGDGVEIGYLSPFLVSAGQTEHFVALMFTVYGLVAAIGAWFSGLLCDVFSSRTIMTAGLTLWVVPQILFLSIAIPSHSDALLLLTYGLRGAGYPLFAYGLLTLLVKSVEKKRLGLAVGLFWFCFTCGLPTLGSVVAEMLLPHYGQYVTLWIALLAVASGGVIALSNMGHTRHQSAITSAGWNDVRDTLGLTLVLVRKNPSLGLACVVRAINSSAAHGIIVFMPFYFTTTLGLTSGNWIRFLEIIFGSNIIFNLVIGFVSDFISWRKTIIWFGGIGSALTCVGMYWLPALYAHTSLPLVYLSAALFGMTLAGYVPLSALTPSLLPENQGIAMSLLNLGAGSSAWIGPFIVYLFKSSVGTIGIIYIYAGLFLLSALLTAFIRLPQKLQPATA